LSSIDQNRGPVQPDFIRDVPWEMGGAERGHDTPMHAEVNRR